MMIKQKQMNVLQQKRVCFFSHGSNLGGAERCLVDLIKLLIPKGVICTVVMPGMGPLKNLFEGLGVEVKTMSTNGWWCSFDSDKKSCISEFLNAIQDDFDDIKQFVSHRSIDAVYTQTIVSPMGALIAEALGLPHFLGIREYGELDHNLYFCFGFEESMNAFYNTSDNVFTVSESVASVVLGENCAKQNVKTNYVKVNVANQSSDVKYKKFGQKIQIGIFGSITDGKNQLEIIKAVCLLLQRGLDVELSVVGSWKQTYYQQLIDFIANTPYKDKVVFTGHTQSPIDLMNTMDIVVSCSKLEGFGRTLIEAILLKIPIVYADTGGPAEIYLNGKHGLAYTLGNEKHLAEQILECINHPKKTRSRVECAYDYISKKFTAQSYSQPIIEALNVINGNTQRTNQSVSQMIMSNISWQNIILRKKFYQQLVEEKKVRIVFFGVSSLLLKVWEKLIYKNIVPDYICDNDLKKQGSYFRDYLIYAPDKIFNQKNDYLVIITSSYVTEIQRQLEDYNNIVAVESHSTILMYMGKQESVFLSYN